VLSVIQIRCKRRRRALAQFKVQSKVSDDFLREQTNEVRISRQSRVVIRKDFLRSGSAADVIVLFQKYNTQACAPKVARCYKSVMSSSQNDNIVSSFHRSG